jgi:hypothetical protein
MTQCSLVHENVARMKVHETKEKGPFPMLFVSNCEIIVPIEVSTAICDYSSSSELTDLVSVQSKHMIGKQALSLLSNTFGYDP